MLLINSFGTIIRKIVGKYLINKNSPNSRFKFFDIGFHGDPYLLQLVNLILHTNCDLFVETGTNVGSTLAYVAKQFPNIQCFSCEPDQVAFSYAEQNTIQYKNVNLFNETSSKFLARLEHDYSNIFELNVLFWLDAHGYGFKWPLLDEVEFITHNFKAAYMLIDDFKVPGMDCFGYDRYEDQECSLDYIKPALNRAKGYSMYFPHYTDNNSLHHSLRGWGLIEFGHVTPLKLPEILNKKVRLQE